jgi:hypothetical protein
MSNDLTQTQGGGEWRRSEELTQHHRQPPAPVPGYHLTQFLGEGAYGEVWVATDTTNPGRRVAVKFYTRRGGDWALLAREVEKLNFLATDRYVVQLLDVGWNSDPPYYVMEFMEKGSLAERLQAGTVPVAEAITLFREIAIGVVNAHNRGVLHCDLKPANVLLGPDGKPRLADFGQSRLSHEQTPALGTLFYMAPEQADLKATPDARWDVYSLGALLYCLLTGEPPYREVPGADALAERQPLDRRLARYRELLQASPKPRKHRRVPGMDRALAEIIDRCLAVNPARRYPNVQAVLDALDARALRRARRPLLVLGALGPVLLLLVMGFLIREELTAAVEKSTEALAEESRVSNQFAAQAVAAKVAAKIDRRWRILEQEAADPGFQGLLRAAQGKGAGTREQRALQARVDVIGRRHPATLAEGWAVFDDQGTLLAYSPLSPRIQAQFIGKNFAYRDYFNGQSRELPREGPRPPPLTQAHRSNVFESRMTGTRKVAFSVPVWDGEPIDPDEQPLGVLMLTVEVGGFAELRHDNRFSKDFVAVLIDRRPDSSGCRGAILDHPLLAQLRKQKVPEKDLQFFVNIKQLGTDSWDTNYTDPVGRAHPEYAGRWLAAVQPVLIEERPAVRDTGWMVLVQERYDVAIGPVLQLEHDMMARGRWYLALALAVVTGLWLVVIFVLNESAGSRWFRFLRRQAGVSGESAGSIKGSLDRSGQPAPRATPAAPTVTERGA